MMDPVLLLLTGIAFGAFFIISGVHKVRDLQQFGAAITGYRIVPRSLVNGVAASVALAEIAIGATASLMPVFPSAGRIGLAAAALMLLVYAAAIGFNIARGNAAIDCGCFGFGAPGPGLRTGMIVRNMAMAALALPAAIPLSQRPLVWFDGITLMAGLATLAVLYACVELALNLPGKELYP